MHKLNGHPVVQFHVPQSSISLAECPRTNDRMQRFACPTPDFRGRYRCIDDRALCNGFFDCPGREDEKPDQCLFFKTVSWLVVCTEMV